jgi:RNA-directed DNA polymerase
VGNRIRHSRTFRQYRSRPTPESTSSALFGKLDFSVCVTLADSTDAGVGRYVAGTGEGNALSGAALAHSRQLFLHYALDHWLKRFHPDIPFCRYGDDGILHCRTKAETHCKREHLACRLAEVGLEMHPDKTRVVYCKDGRRTGTYDHIQFDFLGFTFRPRRIMTRHGKVRTGFAPAVSRQAMTAMRPSLRGGAPCTPK